MISPPSLAQEEQAYIKPVSQEFFNGQGIRIAQCAAASQFSLALSTDGRVFAFGRTADGRLGQGDVDFKDVEATTPLEVAALSPAALKRTSPSNVPAGTGAEQVIQLTCGDVHSLAVTNYGRLFAWGTAEALQLGTGEDTTEFSPVQVQSQQITTLPRAVLIAAAGSQHNILLVKDRSDIPHPDAN